MIPFVHGAEQHLHKPKRRQCFFAAHNEAIIAMIQADVIRNELLNALRHGQIARRVRWDKLHRVRRRSAFPAPCNVAYMQHSRINVYILTAQRGDLAKQ